MLRSQKEIKIIFFCIITLFVIFLIFPLSLLFVKAFETNSSIGFSNFTSVFGSRNFFTSLNNSFIIATVSAVITTILAFLLAYTVNCTNVFSFLKSGIVVTSSVPMLLPTITYGFAIIYSFGKQGLITNIVGKSLFPIYGFWGLLIGYVIYTLPIAFLLINNTFQYIDKKFIVVSKVMGDNNIITFLNTIFRPLLPTLGASFIQAFFLSFTDFGIPAAVGGEYTVIATTLYNQMLGSIPNFNNGAVVAIIMLLPSILSIVLLNYLEKDNVRYNKISQIELKKNLLRDIFFGGISILILVCVLSIFIVVFVSPFMKEWPYDKSFDINKIANVFNSGNSNIYKNSIVVSTLTALFGTLIVYLSAVVTQRSNFSDKLKELIDNISLIINTIPGMVLGIAFLFAFSRTSIHNTLFILIICNIVHFFSTPYLMIKNALSKMNLSWETTAKLMGDSWIKTIVRVITPNSSKTLLEVFGYFFINSMVTVSAIIFLAGARIMVLTTKIKELQHYAKFDEIFVLSLLIFITNLLMKLVVRFLTKKGANL